MFVLKQTLNHYYKMLGGKNMRRTGKILSLVLLVAMIISGCSSTGGSETTSGEGGVFNSGTYTATAQGLGGDVVVEVTFSDDAIKSVKVTDHNETPGIGDTAIEELTSAIVEGQTTEVDVVAGATMTSNAVLEATEDCVNQATSSK